MKTLQINTIYDIIILIIDRRQSAMSNEKIIADINSSMAMEGMPLSSEDKARLNTFLSNPSSLEMMIRDLVKKHTIAQN